MRGHATAWLVARFALLGPVAAATVEQVHLALGTEPSTMAVQWVEQEGATPTTVRYGSSPHRLTHTATSTVHKFDQDPGRVWFNHVANMTHLEPATKYFYQIGTREDVFHFQSQVTPETIEANLPQRHIIYGDLGTACGFTLCPVCTCNLTCDARSCAKNHSVGLVTEVGLYSSGEGFGGTGSVDGGGEATMILHTGDFAYNMGDSNGTVGDQFFRNIEQIAAYVPYMVSIGNHEDDAIHLAHYSESFRLMPANSGEQVKTINGLAPNNWYYSWNDGLIHYVAISTELYTGDPDPNVNVFTQLKWLREDLTAANEKRDQVPWIVVHGHRSLYCSCDSDCDAGALELRLGLEQLLFEQGVDFFLNGHEHNYERNWPTYRGRSTQSNVNPKAPIYIVTGAAGCSELHEPFTRPQPGRSAFRSNNFGYSRFVVHNHSHAHWQQVIMDPTSPGPPNAKGEISQPFFGSGKDGPCDGAPHTCQNKPMGTVIDDTWVVQPHHGPFSEKEAPTEIPSCTNATCKQYDHWSGRLSLGLTNQSWSASDGTVEHIAAFRAQFGEATWMREELKQLDAFENAFGVGETFEDVRADGNSDGVWSGQ